MTDAESQDGPTRGVVEAASTDGSDVSLAGDPGDRPDDVDAVQADLVASHDVGRDRE